MNVKRIALVAFAGASLFSTATVASVEGEFAEVCPVKTAENHPEISDIDAACSCVVESADDDALAELNSAGGPGDLSEHALDALRACGYDI